MDDARFDRIAKRMAGTRSRRGLLAAGVGAVAALAGRARAATAAPYSVPLGWVCYRDRQCVPSTPTDSPNDITYCADNGQYWDGDFNCCRYSGGRCQYDGDCCGYLTCAAGYCYDYYGPPYPGPYYG